MEHAVPPDFAPKRTLKEREIPLIPITEATVMDYISPIPLNGDFKGA